MTTEINSLRVSAEMDATKWVEGTKQIDAANKAVAASTAQVGASFTQNETKISQAGDVLARLSRQYVDGYLSAQRLNSALNQLSTGIERGKISASQMGPILDGIYRKFGQVGDAAIFMARGQTEAAAAVNRLNAQLREQDALARGRGSGRVPIIPREQQFVPPWGRTPPPANQNTQGGLERFGGMNAGFQLQDIVMMAALGQSPATIALQQGPQLASAIKEGGGIKALATGLQSLVSPTMLATVALTGLAAVAIQFSSKLIPQVKSLKDATDEQAKAVNELAKAYNLAGVNAEDFGSKSKIAAAAAVRRSTGELQKSAAEENRDLLPQLFNRIQFKGSPGSFGQPLPEFKDFKEPLQRLREEIRLGHPDWERFYKEVLAIEGTKPGLESIGDVLFGITDAAKQAADQLAKTYQMLDQFNQIRLPERGILPIGAAGDQISADTLAAQHRMQQQFAAETLATNAKSPQELAAAAQAREALNPQGSAAEQATREELAGKRALIDAEHALKDAQDERNRSLNQTIATAQLDVSLIGKTTTEVEGLRMAAQLEAAVREEAARNHVAADEVEIARIREKASEYGKLKAQQEAATTIQSQRDSIELQQAELKAAGLNRVAHDALIETLKTEIAIRKLGAGASKEQTDEMRANTAAANANADALAKAGLQRDLEFERRQMFRSQDEQQVGSRLQAAGLPDDLNSTAAAAIRANVELQHMKDTWQSVFDVANKGVDDVVDALFEGGKDFGEVLKGVGRDFARLMFDLAVTNPIKNWLTGANLNSIADMGIFGAGASSGKGGGFGGALGNLLGAQKAVASMQVQAAVVNINGGVGGIPGVGAISGLLGAQSGGSGNVANIAAAIKQVESSGNYSALGPMLKNGNQALGAYQVMKSNLPSWSTEAFGKPMSASDFLGNPAAQDAIAQQQLGKLFGKYGNVNDTFSAWFTGGPLSRGAGKSDILGTTGSQYVDKANAALDKLTTTTSSLTSATSTATEGLGTLSSGLGQFGSLLSSFMGSGGGSGTGWFQNLSSLFGGATGAVNSMMSISPAATSMILAGGALGPAGLFHEGGIAGFGTRYRHGIDPRIFIGAPRYHNGGLAGDELPAILRRGEPVFKSMAHARQAVGNDNGNVEAIVNALASKLKLQVKNINVFDPSVVGDYTHTDEGEQAIQNVMRRTGSERRL